MISSSNLNDIKREIKIATAELDMPEYAEFMRSLAEWAEDEANIAEFEPDFTPDDE